jgi:hypothetical protein
MVRTTTDLSNMVVMLSFYRLLLTLGIVEENIPIQQIEFAVFFVAQFRFRLTWNSFD